MRTALNVAALLALLASGIGAFMAAIQGGPLFALFALITGAVAVGCLLGAAALMQIAADQARVIDALDLQRRLLKTIDESLRQR